MSATAKACVEWTMSVASERGPSVRNDGYRDLAVAVMANVKKRKSSDRGG